METDYQRGLKDGIETLQTQLLLDSRSHHLNAIVNLAAQKVRLKVGIQERE